MAKHPPFLVTIIQKIKNVENLSFQHFQQVFNNKLHKEIRQNDKHSTIQQVFNKFSTTKKAINKRSNEKKNKFSTVSTLLLLRLQKVNIKRKRGVNRHKIDKEACAGNKNAMYKTISISDGYEKTETVGKSGKPIKAKTASEHHGRNQKRKIRIVTMR